MVSGLATTLTGILHLEGIMPIAKPQHDDKRTRPQHWRERDYEHERVVGKAKLTQYNLEFCGVFCQSSCTQMLMSPDLFCHKSVGRMKRETS